MRAQSLASEVEPETEPRADPGASPVLPAADLIRAVANQIDQGVPSARIARRFHSQLAARLAAAAISAAQARNIPRGALTGGCFQNANLLERAVAGLRSEGFRPAWHRRVPPNDGGISLGQAVASHHVVESAGSHEIGNQ